MNQIISRDKLQPWKPSDATDAIRGISSDDAFTLDLTSHAKDQMNARDLIISDILHVLKHGFVYDSPEQATKPNCYKYKVESTTPAGAKIVRVVAIPWSIPPEIKIVTVMWRDEPMQ